MSSLGHQVVHDGEDALLHFAGVLGTEDNHLAAAEVEGDRCLALHSRDELVGSELSGVVDDVVDVPGEILLEFLGSGDDEHVAHEKSVIAASADHPDFDAVLWVPSRVSVHHVNFPASVQVALGDGFEGAEGGGREGLVDVSPGNVLLSGGVVDNRLGGRHASEWKGRYPVLRPEKATKAPVLEMELWLVSGSAGLMPSPLS